MEGAAVLQPQHPTSTRQQPGERLKKRSNKKRKIWLRYLFLPKKNSLQRMER
jgi:hypothetical protein